MVGKSMLNNKDKATGQREVRPVCNNVQRVNHQNFSNNLTHPHPRRNFVPSAVITNSCKVPFNTAKQSSSRVAASISTARPVNIASFKPNVNGKTNNVNKIVNSAKVNNTAGTKAIVSATEGNRENAIKSSTCWVWRSTGNVINHISKDSRSYMLKRFNYVDLQGRLNRCSRHITGNKSFLTDYQEIDGRFVTFGGSSKGGKITRKGKTRTMKLDFEDVYFVKELKFNLFSVSQICDKKNSVLFTETECLFLSPDFKLLNESQVLLNVPRHNNMYSFDLKNNRVLVTNPHNKTPYELLIGRPPNLDFIRPFGCPVTILNTLDHLGKFEGKADEGFLVRYSINKWLFDIDSLTKSMNYELVTAGNQTNGNAGIETNVNAGQAGQEKASNHKYILLPFMPSYSPLFSKSTDSSTHNVNAIGPSINTTNVNINTGSLNINTASLIPDYPSMPSLEETGIFDDAYDDREVGADITNLELLTVASPIPITRVHKDHPKEQIIGDLNLSTQTRRMINFSEEHAMVSYINKQTRKNHKDYQNCLFSCFLSQNEPKKVIQALADPSWVEAMQEELLQFRLQKVKQKDNGIFISQDKYVADILKKFDFSTVKTASTLMEPNKALIKDVEAEDLDVHLYRSMIRSLIYLTISRPNIMFAVCAYARFQVTQKTSHLHAMKRIFRYLKVHPKLGLWYPRDSPFDLEAFFDSDCAGASLDKKSTTRGYQFLGKREVDNGEQQIIAIVDGKEFTITEAFVRRHLQLADVDDEADYKEWDNIVERATTTAASLDAIHNSETMRGSFAKTRSERVPTQPHNSPLLRVNTLGSEEGILTLKKLTVLCTTLLQKVDSFEADWKHTKQVYGVAYTKLILKVKKLEKIAKTSRDRRTTKIVVSNDDDELEDPSKHGRSMIEQIDQDAKVTLVTPIQILTDAAKVHTYTRRRRAVNTGSGGVSTASRIISTAEEPVSTVGALMPVSTVGIINKDKGIMEESEPELFKATMRSMQDFVPMESESDKEVPKLVEVEGSKRDAEEELDQGSSKKQKTSEASRLTQEQPDKEEKDLSQEDLQHM
uniref:Uncharacterized mitochondrial protein AtMg00810-like n=1 Tax=Tanacetum cinerariifolium TaxID=118510 RepID=A0A6L2NMJ2_TANCI|nr:uncharacterized mitochondrial protein AtMg00810-like [Tanacetum cinerariifolium]